MARERRLDTRAAGDSVGRLARRGVAHQNQPAVGWPNHHRPEPHIRDEPVMIVKWIRSFAYFWYDFVVGDDWRLVVGVVAALGLTGLLAHATSLAAWWAAPVIVVVT